ncbi:IS256 family transposase, partial [Escherichia coli]|nr:IS256 family transposase [Escherichia coli]HAH2199841.1 IS256 family transposase [Escherichia coli]
ENITFNQVAKFTVPLQVFPTDESVRKVIWLATEAAATKWTMPIINWRLAMSRFIIEYGDRLSDHL